MKKLTARVMTGIIASAALIGPLAVGVSSANASSNDCSGQARVSNTSSRLDLPYGAGENCYMGTWMVGTSNQGVIALQKAINACYTLGLTVDGKYGSNTAAAVKEVQRRAGVSQDGTYGPTTKNAMLWPWYDKYTGAGKGCHKRSWAG